MMAILYAVLCLEVCAFFVWTALYHPLWALAWFIAALISTVLAGARLRALGGDEAE